MPHRTTPVRALRSHAFATGAPSPRLVLLPLVLAPFALEAQARPATRGPTSRARHDVRAAALAAAPDTRADAAGVTVPVGRSAEAVVAAAIAGYQAGHPARPVVAAGALIHPFGHGTPTLACSVLRACVVELEPGEQLVNPPISGDQARWIIGQARTGPGGASTVVVVKPTDCAIATNLVVSTDRRLYDVDLVAAPCATGGRQRGARATVGRAEATEAARRVRFYYPDDAPSVPGVHGAGGVTARFAVAGAPAVGRQGVRVAGPNTAYRVVRKRRGPFGLFGRKPLDFPWTPARIEDDGAHVTLTLPVEAARTAAPVLYALEEDGSRTIVNYAVRRVRASSGGAASPHAPTLTQLVTDRVFRRGVLVLTTGAGCTAGREQQLIFENRAWRRAEPARPAVVTTPSSRGAGHLAVGPNGQGCEP